MVPADQTPAKLNGDLLVQERVAKQERPNVFKSKIFTFPFVVFMVFMFQIFDHQEREAEALSLASKRLHFAFCAKSAPLG